MTVEHSVGFVRVKNCTASGVFPAAMQLAANHFPQVIFVVRKFCSRAHGSAQTLRRKRNRWRKGAEFVT
jgi:hypothetical protein